LAGHLDEVGSHGWPEALRKPPGGVEVALPHPRPVAPFGGRPACHSPAMGRPFRGESRASARARRSTILRAPVRVGWFPSLKKETPSSARVQLRSSQNARERGSTSVPEAAHASSKGTM